MLKNKQDKQHSALVQEVQKKLRIIRGSWRRGRSSSDEYPSSWAAIRAVGFSSISSWGGATKIQQLDAALRGIVLKSSPNKKTKKNIIAFVFYSINDLSNAISLAHKIISGSDGVSKILGTSANFLSRIMCLKVLIGISPSPSGA